MCCHWLTQSKVLIFYVFFLSLHFFLSFDGEERTILLECVCVELFHSKWFCYGILWTEVILHCFCSQFVKGLVFKKHAAHKHMPTSYKRPRLLLIQGALGLSSNELSSFESMQQVTFLYPVMQL